KTGGFLHCPLDNEDVGHLGTDMKVQQLETVGKVFGLEHFGSDEQFGGAEAELGILSGALGPTARTFALQAHADAHQGLDADLPGNADDLPQFLKLLDNHDDFLAQLRTQERHADETGVLVTVANDEASELTLESEAGEQFRFAAHLQPEVERLAGIEDFFHDFAELIDFDGE